NEDLLFALKQSFDLYQFIQNQIRECEQKMESLFEQYSSSFPKSPESREVLRSKKQVQKKTEWRLMLKSTVIRSFV
ncbi:MAG: hypothetical protein LBQ01_07990, partial [Prevotellaceae bacterium]|nr:hypothetical protein [Prevotellaceae bacterium]